MENSGYDPLEGKTICHINLARGFRGGERQTELLVRGLSGRGVQQRVVARAGQPLAARLYDLDGVAVREVGGGRVGAVLATAGVDLLHAHQGRAVYVAFLRHLLSGETFVITRRIDSLPNLRFPTGTAYQSAAGIVAISTLSQKQFREHPRKLNSLVIPSVYTGLHATDAFEALSRGFKGKFVVCHIGELDHDHKGQIHLLNVARRFSKDHPEVQFVFVGSGRDRESFEQQSADLDNVTFTGFVENVGDYMAVFDLFAFPSRREGLGSILIDAMQHGLPIVASDVGGIPDLIRNDENGILIPVGDEDALANAILRLKDDAQYRDQLASAARIDAERYAPEVMVDAYLALYRRILGESQKPAGHS